MGLGALYMETFSVVTQDNCALWGLQWTTTRHTPFKMIQKYSEKEKRKLHKLKDMVRHWPHPATSPPTPIVISSLFHTMYCVRDERFSCWPHCSNTHFIEWEQCGQCAVEKACDIDWIRNCREKCSPIGGCTLAHLAYDCVPLNSCWVRASHGSNWFRLLLLLFIEWI